MFLSVVATPILRMATESGASSISYSHAIETVPIPTLEFCLVYDSNLFERKFALVHDMLFPQVHSTVTNLAAVCNLESLRLYVICFNDILGLMFDS